MPIVLSSSYANGSPSSFPPKLKKPDPAARPHGLHPNESSKGQNYERACCIAGGESDGANSSGDRSTRRRTLRARGRSGNCHLRSRQRQQPAQSEKSIRSANAARWRLGRQELLRNRNLARERKSM